MHCSFHQMEGKIVIVTGANTGIGYETAKELAKRGAKVIMACRNVEKAEIAKKQIIEETKNVNVIVKRIDLSSKSSIEEFSVDINSSEERIDVLIHNAGIWGPHEKEISVDGFELTMAANHLGPFLLTFLLLDLLKRSVNSRIIVVASTIYRLASIDPDDLNTQRTPYDSIKVYAKSKLANVLFTRELARRLANTNVTVNCLHPGLVNTTMKNQISGVAKIMKIFSFMGMSPKSGARTSIYLATSTKVEGLTGKYFSGEKVKSFSHTASDDELVKRLWSASETAMNITYPIS